MRTSLSLFTMGVAFVACSTTESGTIGIITGEDDAGPFNEPSCMDGGTPFCGPTPTSITISEIVVESADGGVDGGEDGPVVTLGTEPYSGGSTISLPQESSDDVDILQATAYDSADAAIIFGRTLPVELAGVSGITLDLFVQRRGQFALMPSPFSSALPPSPALATVFENRYILVASQGSRDANLYDLLLWGLVEDADGGMTGITLPCAPLSMAPVAGTTFMLMICPADPGVTNLCAGTSTSAGPVAVTFDISGQSPCVGVPSSGDNTWQSVAGGATVIAPNGDAFIVGGTRPKSLGSGFGPTKFVAKIGNAAITNADGGESDVPLTFIPLIAARQSAAAIWSSKEGQLVVLGGNTDSDAAMNPGVEVVNDAEVDAGSYSSTAVPYPPDMTQGEGAAVLGNSSQILVAGGTFDGHVSPVRLFDSACMSSCQPKPMMTVASGPSDAGSADGSSSEGGPKDAGAHDAISDAGASFLTVPLTFAQGFMQPGAFPMLLVSGKQNDPYPIFIGTEDGGTTHAFVVSGSSSDDSGTSKYDKITEVPLQVSNRTNTTALLSPIPSVVVIGGAATMESYIP